MPLLQDIDLALAEYLYEEFVIKGVEHTYKDTAAILSERLGRYVDPHRGLPHPLGRVSLFCFKELGLPLISVGIYAAAIRVPGEGFYKIACECRSEYRSMTQREAEISEKRLIRECKDWQRLRDYLDGVPVDVIMRKPLVEEITTNTQTVENPKLNTQAMKKEPEQIIVSDLVFPDCNDPVFPDELDKPMPSLFEGAIKPVYVNVRERNPHARERCIAFHGTACAVCNVDLGDVYGEEFSGKIHVHHLKPISEFHDEHNVDPENELCPVCPNCHMIMHCKKDTPYNPSEVKKFIAVARKIK